MNNVLSELAEWAEELPYWEQAALDKILSGKQLQEDDYQELLSLLLEENQEESSLPTRPHLELLQRLGNSEDSIQSKKIARITNLDNVNALVEKQTLTFGPDLTVIYGANGSGKSGYARVLASAGFTRGDREVLPDITKPVLSNVVLSADLELSDGTTQEVVQYQIGKPCPQLASFYVFDSTSVRVHMCEQNPLSFSPVGLSSLKQLADVTDEVRARLSKKISEAIQSPPFINIFQGNSETSRFVGTLNADTSLEELHKLAILTSDERKALRSIRLKISDAQVDQFRSQIEILKAKLSALEAFHVHLLEAQKTLSDEKVAEIIEQINIYHQRFDALQKVSIQAFESTGLTQIGTDFWQNFVYAAKALADAEGKSGKSYPQPDSICLLCQQPLTPKSQTLITRLWEYLESEAQSHLDLSVGVLRAIKVELKNLSLFDISSDFSTPYEYVKEYSSELLDKTQKLVQGYKSRRNLCISAIDTKSIIELNEISTNCEIEIKEFIQSLKSQLAELEATNVEKKVQQLEEEKLPLEHRELLASILPKVEEYIAKCVWANEVEHIGGNTRHITKTHNQLFNRLVTDRYLVLFEETLKALGRPLKVKVQTRGKKGETIKQIVLEADQTASGIAKPEKVLSEGEKRAVALADFLTEVALDTTSNGVILDDPVTSLDLYWRETIASILVEQAKERQVIIFTHDLPFLYYLKTFADQRNIDRQTHWIKRGEQDDRPGYVYLNNSPALERDYRKSTCAREWYAKAKNAPAAEQESILKEGFAALRTSYEAFIIFDILSEVVMRFDERISFGRLKDIVWDEGIIKEVIQKCELLSKYMEGHLHSDTYAAKKPTLELLNQEIIAFETLRNRLSKLKDEKKKVEKFSVN
jgi:ABC-type lipoprotein export system ATPase subunit